MNSGGSARGTGGAQAPPTVAERVESPLNVSVIGGWKWGAWALSWGWRRRWSVELSLMPLSPCELKPPLDFHPRSATAYECSTIQRPSQFLMETLGSFGSRLASPGIQNQTHGPGSSGAPGRKPNRPLYLLVPCTTISTQLNTIHEKESIFYCMLMKILTSTSTTQCTVKTYLIWRS